MKAAAALLVLSTLTASCAGPSARVKAPSPAIQRATADVANQVRRCYRNPPVPWTGRRILTRLLVRYAPDGTLAGPPIVVEQQAITPDNQPYAGRMAEAARLAAIRCSPVRLPPELRKRRAAEFYLTFSAGIRA